MTVTIYSTSGDVIYRSDRDTVREAVIEAVSTSADLYAANLPNTDLSGANLSGANLSGANLGDANLSGAKLAGAKLSDTNLTAAELSSSNLTYANLTDADLPDADLSDSDLSDSYLVRANLSGADMSGAYLLGADMSDADISGADMSGADLSDANLYGAKLSGAKLSGANLYNAKLSCANLYGAKLVDASNADHALAQTRILPEGDLIVWKQCANRHLVKLRIPAEAKRSNGAGRKCRAEYAEVLSITDMNGQPVDEAVSSYDQDFTYTPGSTVRPTAPFNDDMWNECSSGIHFYITRKEAEAHL